MRRTRKRKQKAKIIAKAAVKLSPYVLIFTLGTGAIANYFLEEFKGQSAYEELANDLANDTSDIVEETTTVNSVPEQEPIIEENSEEITEEVIEEEVEEEIYSTNLLDMGYEFKSINFEELNQINEDAVGWIELKDTIIDYPIVQGEDNEYYLHNDINGNSSKNGTIFQDVRDGAIGTEELTDFNVLYGHHMASGAMFASICNYKNPNYVNDHPFAVVYGEDGSVYQAEFFAGQVISGESDEGLYVYRFDSDQEFDDYIEGLKENSTFDSDVELEYGDKILALVTCSYETNNSRYVLYAKLSRQYTNYEEINESNNYTRSL